MFGFFKNYKNMEERLFDLEMMVKWLKLKVGNPECQRNHVRLGRKKGSKNKPK